MDLALPLSLGLVLVLQGLFYVLGLPAYAATTITVGASGALYVFLAMRRRGRTD